MVANQDNGAAVRLPDRQTTRQDRRRKAAGGFAAGLLRFVTPDAMEARAMLADLRRTGCTREFRARVLCVSSHVLRRWEDGTRTPSRAARRLIALTHAGLNGLDGLQVTALVKQESVKLAEDGSRPAEERVEAVEMLLRAVEQGMAFTGHRHHASSHLFLTSSNLIS